MIRARGRSKSSAGNGGGIRLYNELYHHGIKGMKWGIRRYQNKDGTLTEEGRKRYGREGSQKRFADSIKQRYWDRDYRLKETPQIKKATEQLRDTAEKSGRARAEYYKRIDDIREYFISNKDRLNECAELAYEDVMKEHPEVLSSLKISKEFYINHYKDVGGHTNTFTDDWYYAKEDNGYQDSRYYLESVAARHYSDSLNNGMIGEYKKSKRNYESLKRDLTKKSKKYSEELLGVYGKEKTWNSKYSPSIKTVVANEIELSGKNVAWNEYRKYM